MSITQGLPDILRCPATGEPLVSDGNFLWSHDQKLRYPIVDGIPCLLSESSIPTHAGYSELLLENERHREDCKLITKSDIKAYLSAMLVPTCGNLYRGAKLTRYPIPPFYAQLDGCELILDVGCNWGRWSIAAALAGHRVVGVDVHLQSLRIAKAIADELDITPRPLFVLADARSLPFAESSFDAVFSYSVLQHFSKQNCEWILREIGKVLRDQGASLIQMPNKLGLRSLMALAKRGFSEGEGFDVRYYFIPELISLFEKTIGRSSWSVDCFLGLNVHSFDRDMMNFSGKCVVSTAWALKAVSRRAPFLGYAADSVLVQSCKRSS